MSYTDPTLNQSAAHDTGLYDPARHDNQIVAMYETDAQARSAKDSLVASGVPAAAIQLVSRTPETSTLGGVNAEDADSGVWGAIKSLFVPDEDRTAYTHAVGRGHAMLVVTPGMGHDRQMIVRTLEATDPVDFDARLEEWRQSGYDASTVHQDYAAAAAMPLPSSSATMTAGATQPTTATATATAHDTDTIKVMEERLRVGKREVSAGAVRIRSYIVERPVEEQVRLHEEHISVERHPVDRAATTADFGAFQERTIEARATSEEAVVSKDARVVEEIGLKKTGSDRTETIRDTVRKTEVEVEGAETIDTKTGAATGGATTSGANAPRR